MIGVLPFHGERALEPGVVAISEQWAQSMLGWTLTFLFLAVVAAYLGFFGLGGMAASLVRIAFLIFVILLAGSSLIGLLRSEPPN